MKTGDVREALLEKKVLVLNGEVNGEMVVDTGRAIAEFLARGAPPIEVMISSNGGDVRAGLDIYDLLSTYPSEIKGTVYGFARSMAVVILQGCSVRCACAHSRILIHHISSRRVSLDVLRNVERRDEMLKDMEKDQAYLYKILSGRTKRSVDEISEACKKDEDMMAEGALAFGLIDTIVPVREDLQKLISGE